MIYKTPRISTKNIISFTCSDEAVDSIIELLITIQEIGLSDSAKDIVMGEYGKIQINANGNSQINYINVNGLTLTEWEGELKRLESADDPDKIAEKIIENTGTPEAKTKPDGLEELPESEIKSIENISDSEIVDSKEELVETKDVVAEETKQEVAEEKQPEENATKVTDKENQEKPQSDEKNKPGTSLPVTDNARSPWVHGGRKWGE